MRAQVVSTNQLISVQASEGSEPLEARLWLGISDDGVAFEMLVVRVAVANKEGNLREFSRDLVETAVPWVSMAFPPKVIL